MKIKFKRDTSFRKTLFTADHFAHPAKMDAQLLIWLVERYTKVGETILDPMAGSGTTMLACTIGRNVILVELEQKFVGMQEANWEKVKMMPQLGYQMGDCKILQGDARNLENILVDHAIFSPPFGEVLTSFGKKGERPDNLQSQETREIGRIKYRSNYRDVNTRKRDDLGRWIPYGDYVKDRNNIGNLPYGSIDSVIASPPYEGSDISQTHMTSDKRGDPNDPNYRPSWKRKLAEGYADTKRPYHPVDSIIASPPYEGQIHPTHETTEKVIATNDPKHLGKYSQPMLVDGYSSENKNNIGNLKGDTYLSAMLQVYQQCHKVLKPQGLLILVTKNFIRNKEEVRLDEDTIKLCEQAGFQFVERHYRKLPAQSFWRVIYQQKYPDAPILDKEDILIFQRKLASMPLLGE